MEVVSENHPFIRFLPRLHLVIGILTFLVFLGTGQYMRSHFPDIYSSTEVIRYQFRANHIYIFFSALLNVLLGLYGSYREIKSKRTLQVWGSLILLFTPILLILAFFVEPVQAGPERIITAIGVNLTGIGAFLHLLGGLRLAKKSDKETSPQ